MNVEVQTEKLTDGSLAHNVVVSSDDGDRVIFAATSAEAAQIIASFLNDVTVGFQILSWGAR